MLYEPLDNARNEIRVLRFAPSEPTSLIRCALVTVSLDSCSHALDDQSEHVRKDCFTNVVDSRDSAIEQATNEHALGFQLSQPARDQDDIIKFRYPWGDFEALSYTWGDREAEGRVSLNGDDVKISKNLEAALHSLRDLPETRLGMHYWVDSLCINQDNDRERENEVKRMEGIYGKARAVIVWLGPEEQGDREAMEKMRHLRLNSDIQHPSPLLKFTLPHRWDELCAFMKKPYWSRAWIIQELAINHNATLFICGELKLTRRMVQLGAIYCKQLIINSQAPISQSSDFLESEPWFISRRMHQLVSLSFNPRYGVNSEALLDLIRRANATDMRDKIYGILGLLPTNISSLVVPDYALSIRQVYTRFMVSLITATRRLEPITYGGIGVEEGWPSWVADWRKQLDRRHTGFLRRYQASKRKVAEFQFYPGNENYLVCKGVKVDVIDGIGAQPDTNTAVIPPIHSFDRYGERAPEALWRTMLLENPKKRLKWLVDVPWMNHGDANLDPDAPALSSEWEQMREKSYYQDFQRFREANKEFKIGNKRLRDLYPKSIPEVRDVRQVEKQMRRATLSLKERTLVTTNKGYLCLAPEAITRGDIIAVILGCNCPIILRPSGEHYLVLGECYVHGIMNGELFEINEGEETRLEAFVLC